MKKEMPHLRVPRAVCVGLPSVPFRALYAPPLALCVLPCALRAARYAISGLSRFSEGIAIQLSDSEEEEFFVYDSMQISPEKFDFGIERFGCGI